MSEVVYLALGSNIGDREHYLASARQALRALPHTTLIAESSVEETPPIGQAGQDSYLNQMLAIRTRLEPLDLLAEIQRIETENGRERRVGERWGPRTLDIDIVRFGERVIGEEELIVPHPELERRPFWKRQLAEIEGI